MKKRKLLIYCCYLLLLLGCLGIVLLIGKLAGSPLETDPGQQSLIEETTVEDSTLFSEEDPVQDTKVSGKEEETTINWEDAYRIWSRKPPVITKPPAIPETEAPLEEPYIPPTLMLASDLHYFSSQMHDEGEAFWKMVDADDGKALQYSDVMMDTLMAEAIETKPSALILSGDITLNGETRNHQLLAEKLRRVEEAGIPVLVIPGNHDMNNHNAATYFGKQKEEAQKVVTQQDFLEIYHEFGYDGASSRDEKSLSYMYPLDENYWIMMLDSCQYEDRNHVNGRIRPETLLWMEEQLSLARNQGVTVLPVGHHNLLLQSRLYPTECTMENYAEIQKLLQIYEIPLFISGHLHAQRIKQHQSEPGIQSPDAITEIVLSPYSLSPNQYGYLYWKEDGGMFFETRRGNVEKYAKDQGITDENLLQFSSYGEAFLKDVMRKQVSKDIHLVPDDLKAEMASLYANLYFEYCAGKRLSWNQIRAEKSYKLWQRVSPDSLYVKKMGQMLEDVREDLQDWKKEDSIQ